MNKMYFIACLSTITYASEYTLTSIQPAKVNYVKTEINKCNDNCLINFINNGMYISFLSNYSTKNEVLKKYYLQLSKNNDYLDLPKYDKYSEVKIAIIIPENLIKSYSNNIISPSIAYLLKQNKNVKVKVFFTNNEEESNIIKHIDELKNYNFIITGFQKNGLEVLNKNIDNIQIFSPLAKEENIQHLNKNYYIGGLNYKEQIESLIDFSSNKLIIFRDESPLSKNLSEIAANYKEPLAEKVISTKNVNIEATLKDAKIFENNSILFNLPLIKTTLIATQIRAQEVNPKKYLSTQINYHPIFLNLSQENERNIFYFANSIDKVNSNIEYLNDILGQKISYNWISYSTSIGIDYFYNKIYSNAEQRYFNEEIIGQAVSYNTHIMSSKNSKFTELE